jgi:flagellar hook-basal body complex protein FliE
MTAPIGYPDNFGSLIQQQRAALRPAQPESAGIGPNVVRGPAETGEPLGPNFAEHLSEFVSGVDKVQKNARHQGEEFAVGHSNDIHGTMITVEQAEISLRILANVRNRVVDLYREVMRMGS